MEHPEIPVQKAGRDTSENSVSRNDGIFKGTFKNQTDTLWSYVYNLQKARRQYQADTGPGRQTGDPESNMSTHNLVYKKKGRLGKEEKRSLCRPVYSLTYFLETNSIRDAHSTTPRDPSAMSTDIQKELKEPLTRAVVQGIRIAAFVNDYKLLIRLVDAYLNFVDDGLSNIHDMEISSLGRTANAVDIRVLGEAIEGLTRTSVNIGKIKRVWNKVIDQLDPQHSDKVPNDTRISSLVSAREVNAILKALVSHGKVKRALDLYRQFRSISQQLDDKADPEGLKVDSYSITILLGALADSVQIDGGSESGQTIDDVDAITENSTAGVSSLMSLPLSNECVQSLLLPLSLSKCVWQWNEALRLLDEELSALSTMSQGGSNDANITVSVADSWINQVFSSYLTLCDRVCEACSRQGLHSHVVNHRSNFAKACLRLMEESFTVCPDEVTCTLLLKSLAADGDWTEAEHLFRRMKSCPSDTIAKSKGGSLSKKTSDLPYPNEFSYGALMAAYAKGGQYQVATELLTELRGDTSVETSTPVYNSLLQTLVPPMKGSKSFIFSTSLSKKSRKKQRGDAINRIALAFDIFSQMGESLGGSVSNHAARVSKSRPDTVTYNTLLSVLSRNWADLGDDHNLDASLWSFLEMPASETTGTMPESISMALLQHMERRNVLRNMRTYRHAIQAAGVGGKRSLESTIDYIFQQRSFSDEERATLLNEALLVASNLPTLNSVQTIVSQIHTSRLKANADAIESVVFALGRSGNVDSIPLLLEAIMNGDSSMKVDKYCLQTTVFPPLRRQNFEMAVKTCLRYGYMPTARRVLQSMQSHGIHISPKVLQEVARKYAQDSVAQSIRAHQTAGQDTPTFGAHGSKADIALKIFESIPDPPLSVISSVSQACAWSGNYEDARRLLKMSHCILLSELSGLSTRKRPSNSNQINLLRKLHRSLMRSCAESGNVTSALRFCQDIENLSKKLGDEITSEASRLTGDRTKDYEPGSECTIGMGEAEWTLLLVSSAKAGHWRVCLSTLHFLRPFVEGTRRKHSHVPGGARISTRSYRRLSSSLNIALECLARRSQYGWMVRMIDDWIEWSGRRPPQEAVLSTIRALASRGRGAEVRALVVRCLEPRASLRARDGAPYRLALFVGGITALYLEGMYDAADDMFLAAVSDGVLPFNLDRNMVGANGQITLDLHGMNVATAHSAVRMAMQHEMNRPWNASGFPELLIVTGRGQKSSLRMRPVLRPEVQRMLSEEYYPPISSFSVPGNMGALRIPSEDIRDWLDHQRQGRNTQMLAVADLLKKLSTGVVRAAETVAAKPETSLPP